MCVLYFIAYPVLFADNEFTASAENDFVSYIQYGIRGYIPNDSLLAQALYEQAFAIFLEVHFQVYHPTALLEPFVFYLVGAEGYGACGVHEARFVCLGTTHFGFQFFAGSFYFLQSAQ